MANDQDFINAASAVASGRATAEQVALNNRMADDSGPRFGSPLVQAAQDARDTAAKNNR